MSGYFYQVICTSQRLKSSSGCAPINAQAFNAKLIIFTRLIIIYTYKESLYLCWDPWYVLYMEYKPRPYRFFQSGALLEESLYKCKSLYYRSLIKFYQISTSNHCSNSSKSFDITVSSQNLWYLFVKRQH